MPSPVERAWRDAFISKARSPESPRFFISPPPAGRRIVCGFSFVQRIGKDASTDVWFPSSLQESVAERVLAGDASVLDDFRVEWAAVRQFELLQEAGNLHIEDLEVTNFNKAYYYLVKMRAGGHRVTVVTLGNYVEPASYDELSIMDRRIQDEITRLIHMLYLEEQSAEMTEANAEKREQGKWNYMDALPHVALTLGAMGLFVRPEAPATDDESDFYAPQKKRKKKSGDGFSHNYRQRNLSQRFFQILDLLPQNHISHDVAIGLALPEAIAQQNWVYIPLAERQYARFQQAMSAVFSSFDHINLGALHGRENAPSEIKAVSPTMRGYGDRFSKESLDFHRTLARMANDRTGHFAFS